MFDLLTAPYPLRKNTATEWFFILGTGAFVAFFLIVFQPFGTREFQHASKYLFLTGYGVVIAVALWFTSQFLPQLAPKIFNEEKWTVGKHILYLTTAFTLVFFACYTYKSFFLGESYSLHGFFNFFPSALAVAVFPIAGLVLGDYILQLKRYQKGADDLNLHFSKKEKTNTETTLTLPDENGKSALEINPEHLLFLQAADNYVEIYYLENGMATRFMLRNSLSSLEAILSNTPVVRCHRSYLINPDQVARISGNAQGYRLHFDATEVSVPVARSRHKTILEGLKDNN